MSPFLHPPHLLTRLGPKTSLGFHIVLLDTFFELNGISQITGSSVAVASLLFQETVHEVHRHLHANTLLFYVQGQRRQMPQIQIVCQELEIRVKNELALSTIF